MFIVNSGYSGAVVWVAFVISINFLIIKSSWFSNLGDNVFDRMLVVLKPLVQCDDFIRCNWRRIIEGKKKSFKFWLWCIKCNG